MEKAQKAADALKARYRPLSDDHKDILFQEARSQNGWLDEPVTDAQLHELYALTKMGATSMNSCPARFVFLRSNDEKERLKPALAEPNIAKTMSAPVVAIIGYDSAFHKHMGKLFPHRDVKPMFEHNEALREATAFRNGTLQGAYLIMAARAIGLDCGPMSGFNNSAVDEIFFKDTTVKSNFLCCLGQGDSTKPFQRLPRFEFSEVCQIK
ncbi:MAG: malonic semialdehyde reductase [Pseudomonadota bacterium]